MKNDLQGFNLIDGLMVCEENTNRLLIFLEKEEDINLIQKFIGRFPKISILSLFPVTSFSNGISKEKFVKRNSHPLDGSVYVALGKGFKNYDYYITSVVFVNE